MYIRLKAELCISKTERVGVWGPYLTPLIQALWMLLGHHCGMEASSLLSPLLASTV